MPMQIFDAKQVFYHVIFHGSIKKEYFVHEARLRRVLACIIVVAFSAQHNNNSCYLIRGIARMKSYTYVLVLLPCTFYYLFLRTFLLMFFIIS